MDGDNRFVLFCFLWHADSVCARGWQTCSDLKNNLIQQRTTELPTKKNVNKTWSDQQTSFFPLSCELLWLIPFPMILRVLVLIWPFIWDCTFRIWDWWWHFPRLRGFFCFCLFLGGGGWGGGGEREVRRSSPSQRFYTCFFSSLKWFIWRIFLKYYDSVGFELCYLNQSLLALCLTDLNVFWYKNAVLEFFFFKVLFTVMHADWRFRRRLLLRPELMTSR